MRIKNQISVVIITFNRCKELKRAVDSILNQSMKGIELIVVDNNSTDETEYILQKYIHNNKNIKYIKNSKNLGVAGGRNVGFKNTSSEYVYFLDDDAYIQDIYFIEKLLNKIIADERVGVVSTSIYDTVKKGYINKNSKDNEKLLFYQGGSHILKKSLFKDNSLYPDTLMYGGEELFASLIIYDNNNIVIYDKELTVIHEPSKVSRIDYKEAFLNNLVNRVAVKIMLYPKLIEPIIYISFILKFIKNYGVNFNLFIKCKRNLINKLKNQKFKKIKFKTIFLLIKEFGLRNIL
ncbi:glycosyltransferase family 2 protein [Clostridium perfringens]|nr:glycosyltransferase family 2 protein [Clostridium perfringens]